MPVQYTFHVVLLVFLLLSLFASTQAQLLSNVARLENSTAKLCRPVAQCLEKLDAGEKCEVLPVPKRSLIPSPPFGSFLLTKLRRGVYVFYDGGHQALIMKTGTKLAVVDFVDGSAVLVIEAAEKLLRGTVPKTIDMVYSHSHYDHIGGATRFYNYMKDKYPDALISIYGTAETKRAIRASTSKRAIEPNVIVTRMGSTLVLSKALRLEMHVIGGHTLSDMLLYIPKVDDEASVVMFIDVIFPGWSPFTRLALTLNVGDYFKVHEDVLAFDFDIFLGGHSLIGERQDVIRNMKFTEDLLEAASTAIEMVTPEVMFEAGFGKFGDPTAREFGNIWFAFIGISRRLETEGCYRIMMEKWGCELAGLDFTLSSHCLEAVSYNLLEA